MFERPPEQRFLIASALQGSRQVENILNAPQGLRETYGLGAAQVESLRDQLLQGLVTHLYSVAMGLRVSDRLTLDYPEFADLEVQLTERELQTNREMLSEQVRAALPAEVMREGSSIENKELGIAIEGIVSGFGRGRMKEEDKG